MRPATEHVVTWSKCRAEEQERQLRKGFRAARCRRIADTYLGSDRIDRWPSILSKAARLGSWPTWERPSIRYSGRTMVRCFTATIWVSFPARYTRWTSLLAKRLCFSN